MPILQFFRHAPVHLEEAHAFTYGREAVSLWDLREKVHPEGAHETPHAGECSTNRRRQWVPALKGIIPPKMSFKALITHPEVVRKTIFWRMWLTKQFPVTIDLATGNCLVNHILKNIIFYVHQMETHTGLEQLEGNNSIIFILEWTIPLRVTNITLWKQFRLLHLDVYN